jgi:hypothetical protein
MDIDASRGLSEGFYRQLMLDLPSGSFAREIAAQRFCEAREARLNGRHAI